MFAGWSVLVAVSVVGGLCCVLVMCKGGCFVVVLRVSGHRGVVEGDRWRLVMVFMAGA